MKKGKNIHLVVCWFPSAGYCPVLWSKPAQKRKMLATFSNEDEDEDWYDRLGPGTRTSFTAVLRRKTKTFSKPVKVRGLVSSYSEIHQGKCLSKNFVTSLYFSTAIYDSFISKNPDFPHENYQRFNLDSMNSVVQSRLSCQETLSPSLCCRPPTTTRV